MQGMAGMGLTVWCRHSRSLSMQLIETYNCQIGLVIRCEVGIPEQEGEPFAAPPRTICDCCEDPSRTLLVRGENEERDANADGCNDFIG